MEKLQNQNLRILLETTKKINSLKIDSKKFKLNYVRTMKKLKFFEKPWKLLRTAVKKNGVFAAPSIQQTAQHLLEKKRKSTEAADSEPIQQQAAQQLNTTVVTTNTHENETPKPPTPPNNDKLKAKEPDATMFKIRKPKRFRPSPSGGS
ncbi:hypothetical protein ACOSP7_013184 [Xanthoceras sorbifolium]